MSIPSDPAPGPSSNSPDPPIPPIPIKPGDEKLLQTGFGKMFAQMMQTTGVKLSQDDLIRAVKQSINTYMQDCLRDMRHQDKKAKEALAKLKRAAQGQDPDG